MSRRVHLLISLNPYQGNWVIKVRVTSKGNLRTYRNARGEGCVFNVELTDEDVSDNFLLGVLSALAVLVSGWPDVSWIFFMYRVPRSRPPCSMRLQRSSTRCLKWGRSTTSLKSHLGLPTSSSRPSRMTRDDTK
jgi:hypothetical protein